jgi:hypothetical protein
MQKDMPDEAGKPHLAPIAVWASRFAQELAALNGKPKADRMHSHRFEQAVLHAARQNKLRLRTLDAVCAPVEVTEDMADDLLTQRLGVGAEDLRAWAAAHWPELLQSRLLAETAPESVPANPADEWRHASAARKREIAALAVEQCGSQAKAAKSLGITRQRLATVLRNSDATVAPKLILSSWKPRKH